MRLNSEHVLRLFSSFCFILTMNPSFYLVGLLTISTAAAVWQYRVRRGLAKQLRAVAISWDMNYSPGDPLRLTPRIAAAFPVPGAAHIAITDLVYGLDRDHYRYYLATEFTVGLTRSKKRIRRVITFTEPRTGVNRAFSPMLVAPADLGIVEQFHELRKQVLAQPVPAVE
jgi:hypothetical protein